jgi:hypothetical protein
MEGDDRKNVFHGIYELSERAKKPEARLSAREKVSNMAR